MSVRSIKKTLKILLLGALISLVGCSDIPWNNPYPAIDKNMQIYYDSFSERPKHLDPIRAYSANEYVFIGQTYEPPLQYHFLKRPYQLTTLTAKKIPTPIYLNRYDQKISADNPSDKIAKVRYRIELKAGIYYQPHPAFATDEKGHYYYHKLTEADLQGVYQLKDFPKLGTRELVAADYIYQIKRMADPKVHSPIAGLMMKYIFDLKGLAVRLHQYQQNLDIDDHHIDLRHFDCAGLRVIDRYTFEIDLQIKYPQFIYWLAMYFFSPMPWEAEVFYQQPGMAERNISLDWYPIGTGPFMLTENNPNRRMVMKRNPQFRGELYPNSGMPEDKMTGLLADRGKAMPFIDMAIYSLEKEAIPSWNKFLQGYYDTSGIVSDSFDQAIQFSQQGEATLTDEMRKKDIKLLQAASSSIYYMGFNMQDEIIGGDSDRARLLRRAIAIAVDYEEFISIFANGRGIPAHGPLPPGIFGYQAGVDGINPYVYKVSENQIVRRPITEAQALMAMAGYINGRDPKTSQALILYLDTLSVGAGSKARFDWLRKQFAKIGINLIIRATDYNRFQEKMLKGTAQIFQWGWNADYPDPENFLFLLYGPNIKVNRNGENAANYQNAEFDRLFSKMRDMPNGSDRQLIIDKMIEIIRVDSPWLWGYHPIGFSLHHSWYKNAKPNLMANNTLKYKRILTEDRAQAREGWNQPIWWPLVLLIALLLIAILPACWMYFKREQKQMI